MMAFLWSGAMAQRGEVSPALPGLLFGVALFFHTTALFAAPALLWLALRPGPKGVPRGGWAFRVVAPALIGPFLAVILHLAAGFDQAWLRKEFLESKNQRTVLIALTGSHGLLSLEHAKDLVNWLLLAVPVTGWLILSSVARLRRRLREPDLAFLSVQFLCFLVAFLLLDRKLGAARDWDLLAAQVPGLAWVASRLFEDESEQSDPKGLLPGVRIAAPWIATLAVVPWLLLNSSTDRSLVRFDDVRRDFPRFPRAYAAEELGKYYRDHGDLEKSLGFYEECVATFPSNARTRILLGTNYLMLQRVEEAIEQYDTALEIDPGNWMALDMKAKVALTREDYAAALPIYRELVKKRRNDPDAWSGYGLSALQTGAHEEALRAFQRASRLRPDPNLYYYVGLCAGGLERWDDAILWLERAVRAGEDAKRLYALAVAYATRHQHNVERGGSADPNDLLKAKELAERALVQSPENEEIQKFVDRLAPLGRQ
jgi:tetratricopeptide (TPR) repeat protein